MTVEKVGRRYYITGNTYGSKDALKAAGCHWDPGRRAWWTAKQGVAERFGGKSAPAEPENPDQIKVMGKARYKGREYFIRWVGACKSGEHKARLCSLDGKLDFWARCAETGYRPAEGEACVIKMYQENRTLGSIRRFIDERKAEEAAAKRQVTKVAQVAQGEATREIRKLTDQRIIKAFFADRAAAYDFTITPEEFDEEDNWGPGRYVGVRVPASLADRWDAGLAACKERSLETRSREGLTLRYRLMMQDDNASLPAALEELLAEREQKAAAEAAKKAEAAREKAAVDALLDGLVQSSVGPTAPETVEPRIDGEAIPHHMATADPGACTFGGDRISHHGVTYTEGRLPDGRRVVREDIRGYDDYRTYYWAPQDVAKAWALAYAKAAGITAEQAREWLAKYNGCHGSDLYRAIVD